mgnify:CR=1 FL=1
MKIFFKYSPLLLLLTLPLFSSTPYAGVPLWALVSIAMTIIYAIVLIFVVDKGFKSE